MEIPLSFEKLRGYGIKWPLAFFYTSNIPVILTAALVANVQLFGSLVENTVGHATFLGGFSNGQAISGLAFWFGSSNVVESIIRGSLQTSQIFQAISHLIFYMIVSSVFAFFWVKTSGMDESSQAKNIIASGLQIPGLVLVLAASIGFTLKHSHEIAEFFKDAFRKDGRTKNCH